MSAVNRTKARICIVHTGAAAAQLLLGLGPKQVGGAELQLSEIARELHKRGWQITFALGDCSPTVPSRSPEGIRVVGMKPRTLSLPILRFLFDTLPGTWQLVDSVDADMYLQMGVGWQNGLIAWAARRRGRKFILWMASRTDPLCDDPEHSRLSVHERWLAKYGLKNADVVVAQTIEQQQLLGEHHGRSSVLVRNIWRVAGDYDPPAGPWDVLWAARVLELKRPNLFLDVAEALPNIRFSMAAAPAEGQKQLYERIKTRALHMPNVDFLGFVPFREIDKYYARASAYLCTSTIEGFPNTFLQAWSHGRPVVSTFDPDEVICEHNLGFHCQDFDELVGAVRTACENSSDYAERVRTYLRKYHSPEVIMPQIERVLLGE